MPDTLGFVVPRAYKYFPNLGLSAMTVPLTRPKALVLESPTYYPCAFLVIHLFQLLLTL